LWRLQAPTLSGAPLQRAAGRRPGARSGRCVRGGTCRRREPRACVRTRPICAAATRRRIGTPRRHAGHLPVPEPPRRTVVGPCGARDAARGRRRVPLRRRLGERRRRGDGSLRRCRRRAGGADGGADGGAEVSPHRERRGAARSDGKEGGRKGGRAWACGEVVPMASMLGLQGSVSQHPEGRHSRWAFHQPHVVRCMTSAMS
jgi:hypothetical protein